MAFASKGNNFQSALPRPKSPVTMRPYYVLLMTLTLLIACTNAMLTDTPVRALAESNDDVSSKRMLRTASSTTKDDDDDDLSDEDRGLLSSFNYWKLRHSANKQMKKPTVYTALTQKQALQAAKTDAKVKKMLAKSLNKNVEPSVIYSKLGLTKLTGGEVMRSPNYKYYEDYLTKFSAKTGTTTTS